MLVGFRRLKIGAAFDEHFIERAHQTNSQKIPSWQPQASVITKTQIRTIYCSLFVFTVKCSIGY